MALVFQYGSNTSSERLNHPNRLCGDARDLGLVYTRDSFELYFPVRSKLNNCAAADIRLGEGHQIWGVLNDVPDYLIDRSTSGNRKSFDAIEGKRYERRIIAVLWPDGKPVRREVFTYSVRKPEVGLRTSLDYASHILRGLREHYAPEEYIGYVKSRIIANNPELENDIDLI